MGEAIKAPAEGGAGRRALLFFAVFGLVLGLVALRWVMTPQEEPAAAVAAAEEARVKTPPGASDEEFGGGVGGGARPAPPAPPALPAPPGAQRMAPSLPTGGPPAGAAPSSKPAPEETPQAPSLAAEAGPAWLKYLPYATEGGLALLVGLLLGFATKAVTRLIVFIGFLCVLAVGYFVDQGVLQVDQVALAQWVHRFVLQAGEQGDWLQSVQQKIPSLGSLGVGFLIGWRR